MEILILFLKLKQVNEVPLTRRPALCILLIPIVQALIAPYMLSLILCIRIAKLLPALTLVGTGQAIISPRVILVTTLYYITAIVY